MEQKHSPDESEPREKEQPPLPAPTPATAAASDPRTPAQQVLDLNAAMEKRLGGGASPAEAGPAAPEPKQTSLSSTQESAATETASKNSRRKTPWALICWALFFGTMFGSCNGWMMFRDQREARMQKEYLTEQESQRIAQKQQEESTKKKQDAIAANASASTKERIAKMRECIAATPPSLQGDAIEARSQLWLHYCLTGKPPNFKTD